MADDDALERQANRVCKVYDNADIFTVFVQLFLALAALLSLWIKREYEHPKRRFVTWFLDVSKQGVGACYAHVMNMVRASFKAKWRCMAAILMLSLLVRLHILWLTCAGYAHFNCVACRPSCLCYLSLAVC